MCLPVYMLYYGQHIVAVAIQLHEAGDSYNRDTMAIVASAARVCGYSARNLKQTAAAAAG
jgi:hypothetical protein